MSNGWRTSAKKPVENRELWIELIEQVEKFKFLSFVKVKGHSGEPGNERADELANKAMDSVK
jgi:ribonuclease HI